MLDLRVLFILDVVELLFFPLGLQAGKASLREEESKVGVPEIVPLFQERGEGSPLMGLAGGGAAGSRFGPPSRAGLTPAVEVNGPLGWWSTQGGSS